MRARPDVIVILADDMGYSDAGCFGGEISTPNLDRIGRHGTRFTHFYNTARCSPSRASLLTGRHPHQTGIGILTTDDRPHGYAGSLDPRYTTMAERLSAAGYATCLSGKWHVSSDTTTPDATWPTRRGFDEFYGIIQGADDYFHPSGLWHGEEHRPIPSDPGYYLTDDISRHAAGFVAGHAGREPYLLYLAYTAPHWPLQAPEQDVGRYRDAYASGWDRLRRSRMSRMLDEGILPADARLSDRDPTQPAWADAGAREWQARRMAVYAAQVEIMDRGIGRVLDAVDAAGTGDDTIVLFLSDNGASAEELPPPNATHFREGAPATTPAGAAIEVGNDPDIMPGPDTTFSSYGRAWANLSNTPFRLYKRWVHEGGIATPLIIRWPNGLPASTIVHEPFQLTDVLPTLLEATEVEPCDDLPGVSMLPVARGERESAAHDLFWEHMGNAAIRRGRWKLVREAQLPWELYDIVDDRSEVTDLAAAHPDVVDELSRAWRAWADAVGVLPWPRTDRRA